MDEYIEFKHLVANASGGGTDKEMILMPYAKDLVYNNGELSFTLEFFNNDIEMNIGITSRLSEELIELIDNALYGEEK